MTVLIKLSMFTLLCVYCEAQLRNEMSAPKLIKAAGYPVEKHRVVTEDGYLLQLHRIPAGRRSARKSGEPNAKGKKAVLIVHGMLSYSSHFVIMGPKRSLGYILADAGYDVWLGNMRGTDYSAHETITKNESKFWNFSFHEHGIYDIPAMIDKTLSITGLEKILYVGHSMGTTSYFVMLSEKPEYNDKLIAAVALAPAVYLDNVQPIANLLLKTINVPSIFYERGMVYLSPQLMKNILNMCALKNPEQDLCIGVLNAIVGEDNEQIDLEMLPLYMNTIQAASAQVLEHYGKIALTGVFTKWGGGIDSPVELYNLSNVRTPTSLLYGENDQLTEKYQIMRLAHQLNATGTLERIEPCCSWPKFNHIDFVFAKDLGKLLNRPLAKHIDELYNKYGI